MLSVISSNGLQCTAFRGIAAVHLQQLVQRLNWLVGLISSVSQTDVQAPIVLTFQKHHFRVCRGHHLGSGLAAIGLTEVLPISCRRSRLLFEIVFLIVCQITPYGTR